MVYDPDQLYIAAGDTVSFVPKQSSHNAASVPALLPAEAEPLKSRISRPFEQASRCRASTASSASRTCRWAW